MITSAFPLGTTLIVAFAALARGAHDLWSATAVHAALLLLCAAGVASAWAKKRPIAFPMILPAVGLIAAWMVSTAMAANRADAIFAVKDLAACLLAFYLGANAFESLRSREILVSGAAIVLTLQAALIARDLLGAGGASLGGEAPGSLINANLQAAFVLFWIPPLADRWRADRRRPIRALWTLGLLSAAVVLFGTASAWALVCVFVPGLLYAGLTATKPPARRSLLSAAVLFTIAVVWYKVTKTYEWNAPWLPPRSTVDRMDWWKTGWRMFEQRPFIGIGPGGYASAFAAFKIGVGQSTRFAHSLPVTLLAETGVLGVAAAIAFAAAFVRNLYAAGDMERLPFVVGAALFVAFTSVSLGGEVLANQLVFFLLLGLAVTHAPSPRGTPRLSAAILAGGLAILVLPTLAAPFLASRVAETGRADLAEKREEDAIGHYKTATDIDPASWEAWRGLSESLWSVGRLPEAIDAMDRASRLNHYDAAIIARKAEMLAGAGREDEAELELQRAYLLNPRLFSKPGNR